MLGNRSGNVGRCAACGEIHENPKAEEDLAGMPEELRGLLEGGPEGLIGLLLGSLFGAEVSSKGTMVMIGADGTVKTKTVGSHMEEVDLSTIDQNVIQQLQEAADFKFALRDKRERAENLRRETSNLERKVRQIKVRLSHSLWNQVDSRYYGDKDLEIGREGEVVRINRHGDHLCVVEGELGQQLMAQQDEIDAMETSIRDKSREATQLELECRHQPELAQVMQESSTEALFEHLKSANPDLLKQIMSRRARIGINAEGRISIRQLVEIDEESNELPDEVRDLMAVMQKYHPDPELPGPVAKLFGLEPVAGAIADESSTPVTGKDVIPPGTFMAGTNGNGNGHHHEGECPATSEPIMVAAGEVPIDEPDGGRIGD